MPTYEKAIYKYNNGNGALLCNSCSVIITTGFKHEDKEHYCNNCQEESPMDEYVYYWEQHDVYCYHSELLDYIDMFGQGYEVWLAVDFFATIWNDEEP